MTLTPAQLEALEELTRRYGEARVARLLGTSVPTLDTLAIGRGKAETALRIGRAIDAIRRGGMP